MKLERGDYGNPDTSVLLPWAKVAKRIGYLIDNQQFLRSADYSRMPEYERERIAGKVISFYARLPEEIERPFKQDFFNEEARKELPVMLNDSGQSQKLLQAMDDALAMLPLDFESVNETYEKKLQLLTEVHQYVEGSYTIFPAQEVPDQADGLNGYQMSLFDIVSASEPEENIEDAEPEEIISELEAEPEIKPEEETEPEDIKEQIVEQEPHNFHITDDDLGSGGSKAKFKANMEAIRMLKNWNRSRDWQHRKNRKCCQDMLDGAAFPRLSRKETVHGQRNIRS